MKPPSITRAITGLAKRFNDEPAAVLADPLWQEIRALDSGFLAKLPAPFRVDLLRHEFMSNPEDPWAPLPRVRGEAPAWPTWEVPAWEIGWGSNPKEAGGILSQRIDLARGWSFVFAARPAEVRMECHEIEWEDDEGHDDTEFPLDRVLTLLFADPAADPREALGGSFASTSPCDGVGIHGVEVRLYPPGACQEQGDDGLVVFFEDEDGEDDAAAIADLVESRGLFRRVADAEGAARPLFELTPVINHARRDDGILRCTWRTKCYVPVDAAAGAEHWWYEQRTLDVVEKLRGTSVYDLKQYAWDYQMVKDLEEELGKVISEPLTHQFLVPLYEHVLFVRGEARRLS